MDISNESLLQDQSSKSSRRIKFFIPFIIIFTLIILAMIAVFITLKNQIDSESLASNPMDAIREVCHSGLYISEFEDHHFRRVVDRDLCIKSISLLNVNSSSKTNPSKIFSHSLLAASNQLSEIILSTKTLLPELKNLQYYEAALMNCSDLFGDSLTHLTRTRWLTVIGDHPDESLLRNKKRVGDMKTWIGVAKSDIESCVDLLSAEVKSGSLNIGVNEFISKANMVKAYVSNSLMILENIDKIFNMFYPPIAVWFGDFTFTKESSIFLAFFCSQFLFLSWLLYWVYRR